MILCNNFPQKNTLNHISKPIDSQGVCRLVSMLAVLLLLLIPIDGFSWGRTGHHIVARIAMTYLEPSTRERVLALLDKTSAEDAATWMDDIQVSPDYDHMKSWHHIHM